MENGSILFSHCRLATFLQQVQKDNNTPQSNPIKSQGMKKLKAKIITKSPSMINKKLHGRRLNSTACALYELSPKVILL
jgi:hypothetical protein